MNRLKIRSISYLSYKWDNQIPLMVRQQFIEEIIWAINHISLAKILLRAGMSKDDITIMYSKVLPVKETQDIMKNL